MKVFVDENLSPLIARRLNETGWCDAIHPRDLGKLGLDDSAIVAYCIKTDRAVLTQNYRDFEDLVGKAPLHPGLLVLPQTTLKRSIELALTLVDQLRARGNPADVIVNHIAVIKHSGEVSIYEHARRVP